MVNESCKQQFVHPTPLPRITFTFHAKKLYNPPVACYVCETTILLTLFVLSESKPMLDMNATAGDIADGDIVKLSCSLKYRTSSGSTQENVHVTIGHPGAEEIEKVTKRDVANEIRSVVIVKVNGSKDTEQLTFGPVQCKVDFTQPSNDTELAHNAVQITSESSDNMSAVIILCKYVGEFITFSRTLKQTTYCTINITRNTFCGTWYLRHSHVHNERTVPIIISRCVAHV